nr:DUF2306 domain-containing protein [uncultured Flavobacterium sp.]
MDTKKNVYSAVLLFGKIIILFLSVWFVIRSLGFFFKDDALLGRYLPVKAALLLHLAAGCVAIVTGPFLFIKSFRRDYPKYHRLLGKTYLISVKIAAMGALVLVVTSARAIGIAYEVSLHVEGIAWTVSAILAWRFAWLKKFEQHNHWVTRNYIIVIAFLAQSTVFRIPQIVNLAPYESMGPTIIWVSWTVPLFVYDVILSYGKASKS